MFVGSRGCRRLDVLDDDERLGFEGIKKKRNYASLIYQVDHGKRKKRDDSFPASPPPVREPGFDSLLCCGCVGLC
jgi:hypothetical protein